MNKTVLVLAVLLLATTGAYALELNVMTIPAVLTPGTNGKLILMIAAPQGAQGIEVKITGTDAFSIEDQDSWVDVGDALGGVVSYALGLSVPKTTAPGTYILPITVQYTDPATGKAYEEHFSPILTVTAGKGVDVNIATDRVYGEREMSVKFTVSNSGEPIYNAKLIVPVAMGDAEKYIGALGSGESKSVYVDILPVCKGGIYRIPIIIKGYRGTAPFFQEVNYNVKCIPPTDDLRVSMDIPEQITGGEQNTTLTIQNLTSVATGPISVAISGENVRIGGQTAYYINSLPPMGKVQIPVIWKLAKSDEAGAILVTIVTPEGKRTYSYAVIPKTSPQITIYPSSEKWENGKLHVALTVANTGTGTAETVFVSAEGNATGKTVIGDLSPGDYDTADVYLTPTGKTAEFKVLVTYVVNGEEKKVEKTVEVSVPPKPGNAWLVVAAVIVVIGAIWWWRKKR